MTRSTPTCPIDRSILGHGVVVHEKADDFGQPVGNAGGRLAVGVIGIAKGKLIPGRAGSTRRAGGGQAPSSGPCPFRRQLVCREMQARTARSGHAD